MKRTILGAALGIVLSVAPAHGQGHILFNNYGTSTDAIVTTCRNGAHVPVDSSSFTAGLRYGFGTITDPALLTLHSVSQSFNPATPGYFQGPVVTIPGYSGGPITFQVVVYPDYGNQLFGSSELFTLPSIATGTFPVGDFGPGLKPFYAGPLSCVPEPSTIALVGLGLVSLLIFRRRKL